MKNLPNILVVDDNIEQLEYFGTILNKLNVNLILAESGLEALGKTKGLELALAIIDVRMPIMNGYELAAKMHEERSGEKVPIIFLTASHIHETQVFQGYDTGAVDYLFKPADNHILLCKVNVFIDLFNQKKMVEKSVEQLKKFADELMMANATIKKSEEKYRMLFNVHRDSIVIFRIDGDGAPSDFIESNEATLEILGYTNDEIRNLKINDLEENLNEEKLIDWINILQSRGRVDFETIIKDKDGNLKNIDVKAILINYLNEPAVMIISRNINERKLAEAALKKKSVELEQFNNLMIGRELKMVELKKEINELLIRSGQPEKYVIHK